MNRARYLGIIVAAIISLFFIFSQRAYACIDVGTLDQAAHPYYIDAGTGSIIIQFLIGALVGLGALAGVYRARVKNFLRSVFKKQRADDGKE
jgi:hypothetical protein